MKHIAKFGTMEMVELRSAVQNIGLADGGGAPVDEREVIGAYCSDLLSDVMGQARPGEVWITIQSHMNVVAVAALKELAAVVICGGRAVEPAICAKAREEGVILLCTQDTSFEVCGKLWDMGLRRAG